MTSNPTCELCGRSRDDHDEPRPSDWYLDPGAYPCDRYRDGTEDEAHERVAARLNATYMGADGCEVCGVQYHYAVEACEGM